MGSGDDACKSKQDGIVLEKVKVQCKYPYISGLNRREGYSLMKQLTVVKRIREAR